MNAHQQTISLGAGNNHALWLLQRKAQAHHEMQERIHKHLQVVWSALGGAAGKALKWMGEKNPFPAANPFSGGREGKLLGQRFERTVAFRFAKEVMNVVSERRRELETLRRQQNLVKLKNPATEVRVRLKKLHATSLSIPPEAAPRFSFR